jgi:glyoxylase-like metal-dependent hydrolase (beta-lactamase superfamily II)
LTFVLFVDEDHTGNAEQKTKHQEQSTMLIEQITVTAFQQHTRIIGCEQTKQAICIDPGDDSDAIVEKIDRLGLNLQAIAITHAHLDHVGGVAALKKLKPDAKVTIHPADEPIYLALPDQPAWLGIPRAQWAALGFEYEPPPPVDEYFNDGQHYSVGNLQFQILHCPGHTPGHVVLFEPNEKKVFVGDVLFAGSIGRTDLPGGSTEQLLDSIHNKLLTLGDDVEVFSGHGPVTTIGEERLTNPFLTGGYKLGKGRF